MIRFYASGSALSSLGGTSSDASVAAVAGQTGWEGTMPRLDGVVSVVDSDDHVLPLFRC